MESLTEHRGVAGPVVYGYLRLVRTSAARQEALAASLAEYCRQHELLLSGVFTERLASGTVAFTGLLDVLVLPDTYGVVLPATSHLGPKTTAAERERRIEAAGARLLPVRSGHRPPVAYRIADPPGPRGPRRRSPGRAPALDVET
ncbi:hypothetical protein [Streptomyces sp. NPDC059479]|uniref:hypothetical protein n=1 Tax=Streptomyces sp. NPDC059479 TaxID=3346848 RepID=UPI0036965C05